MVDKTRTRSLGEMLASEQEAQEASLADLGCGILLETDHDSVGVQLRGLDAVVDAGDSGRDRKSAAGLA